MTDVSASTVALDFILRVDDESKRTFKAEHGYYNKPVRVVKLGCKVGETFVVRDRGHFEVFLITDIPSPYHYKVVAVR